MYLERGSFSSSFFPFLLQIFQCPHKALSSPDVMVVLKDIELPRSKDSLASYSVSRILFHTIIVANNDPAIVRSLLPVVCNEEAIIITVTPPWVAHIIQTQFEYLDVMCGSGSKDVKAIHGSHLS